MRPLYMALIHPEASVDLVEHRAKLKRQCRALVKDLKWDAELKGPALYKRRSSLDYIDDLNFDPSHHHQQSLLIHQLSFS